MARQRELRGAGEDRKCSARRGKATRSTRAVAGGVRQWCQCWDTLTHPCALGRHHSVPVCLSSPNTSCFHIFTRMASCLNVLFSCWPGKLLILQGQIHLLCDASPISLLYESNHSSATLSYYLFPQPPSHPTCISDFGVSQPKLKVAKVALPFANWVTLNHTA